MSVAAWSPELHPRWEEGSEHGGEFRPKVASRVASTYKEAADLVTEGFSRKIDREWQRERPKLRAWLDRPPTGRSEDDDYRVAGQLLVNKTENNNHWANSNLLDQGHPLHQIRPFGADAPKTPDEFIERIDDMVEAHKESRLPVVRKALRGIVEKDTGEMRKAYSEVREAVEENDRLPRYTALRDRWEIPDTVVLISETGYGRPLSGINDVLVTASRDVRMSDHTSVNALAMKVEVSARERGWSKGYDPKPGDDHMTRNSVAALLRHEWAHSVWENMTDEQQAEFEKLVPYRVPTSASARMREPDWDAIGAGLSKYAGGDPADRERYDKNEDRPAPGYLTETFAEAVALTTGDKFNRNEWPEWVGHIADYIDALEP